MPPGTRLPRRLFVVPMLAAGWMFAAGRLSAQTPTPAPPAASPTPAAAAPTPPATQDDLIDALNPAEVQEAINLLRANYIRPPDVDDRALARATLAGELTRLGNGASLLAKPGPAGAPPAAEQMPDTFQSEILGQRAGYVRLGALTRDHLAALDKALRGFNDAKLPALILDLRATGVSSDYDLAADVVRRFVAKGKPLFTLRKPSNNQDRLFTSNADPAFTGLIVLAVDADTAGAAEAIAAVIRYYDRCLVVGENTAGQAVEYADLRLSGGSLLRVAVSQVLLPANLSIFPDGVKPDVSVIMPRADLLAIFKQAGDKDHPMASFVLETERPRFNEAALGQRGQPGVRRRARRPGRPPPGRTAAPAAAARHRHPARPRPGHGHHRARSEIVTLDPRPLPARPARTSSRGCVTSSPCGATRPASS